MQVGRKGGVLGADEGDGLSRLDLDAGEDLRDARPYLRCGAKAATVQYLVR